MSITTELEQCLESRLRDTICRLRPTTVIDDERNLRHAQHREPFVQLIAFTLNMELPAPLPHLSEESRHRGMLQYIDAVGDKVEADTDDASAVQFVERMLVGVRRHPRDAFETPAGATDCRYHAPVIVTVPACRIDEQRMRKVVGVEHRGKIGCRASLVWRRLISGVRRIWKPGRVEDVAVRV